MNDSSKQAGSGAIAMVARGFEPVRIERQLLARAFDLVCESQAQVSSPSPRAYDPTNHVRPIAVDVERRRVA